MVGESGCGKSVTAMSLMGLTRGPNAEITGQAMLGQTELIGATEDELRKVRGNEMAMIFQDPMSSLNPVYKVGDQIVEQIQAHRDVSDADAHDQAVELLEAVGIPGAEQRADSFPHEFSGGMRQRAMIAMGLSTRARAADRRRADHRARRDDPGADHAAAAQAQRGAGPGDDPDHPRPGRRRRHRRPRPGHVRGRDRRVGDARADLLRPPAPVHVGPPGLDHAPRPAAQRPARPDQGAAAVADLAARGLQVPAALPARVRQVHAAPRRSRRAAATRATSTAAGSTPSGSGRVRTIESGDIGLEAA